MNGYKVLGIILIMASLASFAFMIYGIVAIHPLCALLMFVFIGLMAGGLLAYFRGAREAVGPLVPRDEPPRYGEVPRDEGSRSGSGNGYCPNCGSPLDGGSFCRVCGKRVRSLEGYLD